MRRRRRAESRSRRTAAGPGRAPRAAGRTERSSRAAASCRRRRRPAPARRSSASGTCGGPSGRSTRRPARGTRGAGTRGTPACRPARRGCASTGGRPSRRDGIGWQQGPYVAISFQLPVSSCRRSSVLRAGFRFRSRSWQLEADAERVSPVARRAAGQLCRRCAILYSSTSRSPRSGSSAGPLPGHVEDLVARPHVLRRDCGGSRGTTPSSACAS